MVTDGLSINISANTGNTAQNINNAANALTALDDKAKSASTDMSGLVNDMTAAASSMVSISQNISASAAGLGGFRSNIEAVNAALQGVNIRFDTLNSSIQASYSAFYGAAASVSSLSAASEASAAGLGSVVAATDGFADKMGDLRAATTETTDGMSDLQRELRDTLTSLRGFSDNVTTAGQDAKDAADKINELVVKVNAIPSGGNLLGLAAGFKSLKGVIATLGIGKFIKDSNDAYNVQMQNELKLTSHMKHRMNATDEEIKSVKELASAQQKLGVIGDEIQLAGAQQLTTYARQSSTLKTLIPAMNNLIAQNAGYEASVVDATSAADMLGRALSGQYTALQRQGVYFTEAQEQVLKYGTEGQKAAVLADAINSKVGNMNELLANTPTGQLKQLQNDFGDLQEEIGATFQPLISAIVPVAKSVMETLREPILNVSKGIATLGAVIKQADPAAVRAIALTTAAITALVVLKNAVGGVGAGLLVLGAIIAGTMGGMAEEQQNIGDIVSEAYNTGAKAADNATDAISDYNDEIATTEKSVKRLAGFDTITKLSGGSGSGALVNALLGDNGLDMMKSAVTAANEVDAVIKGISTPDIDLSKIDFNKLPGKISEVLKNIPWDEIEKGAVGFISHIEWRDVFKTIGNAIKFVIKTGSRAAKGILEGFADWIREEDWQKDFISMGTALENVFGATLDVVDALFKTHFRSWYEDYVETSHNAGETIEQALNPDDEGIKAIEDYEKQNGSSAYENFRKLYEQGISPEVAFKQVYNTDDLKKGFFAAGGFRNALDDVSEWEGLDERDLILNLYPNYYNAKEFQSDLENVFTKGLWGICENIFDIRPSGANRTSYDYIAELEAADEIASQPVAQHHETSYTDVPLKPVGVPSSVMEKATVVNFNVDGETITSLVVKDGEVEKYNGKGVD